LELPKPLIFWLKTSIDERIKEHSKRLFIV